jgi:hypothetical protein
VKTKKIIKIMAYYLKDVDLYYEIILSKGKGYLTPKAEHYIQLIATNAIKKKAKHFKNPDDLLDCLQHGILIMLEKWMNFDELKFKQALPYFTEVFKRGMTAGYNNLYNKKPHQQNNVKFVSLDSSNDGKGLYNIF